MLQGVDSAHRSIAGADLGTRPRAGWHSGLAALAFGLAIAACWITLHPYYGLWHDADLYTLQALARLKPNLLGGDLFLRFGSQDAYTVFSPIYAEAISMLGVEHAAALLTLFSQGLFVGGLWLLARKLVPRPLLCLSVGLVIALPGDYGAGHVFQYLEEFVTPRIAAEAFVLAALAALIAKRPRLASAALAVGALVHPLMAVAGIGIACLAFIAPRWRQLARTRWTLVALGALTLAVVALLAAGRRLDPEWLAVIRPRRYLFVLEWSPTDWARVLVPLGTAAVGVLLIEPSPARTLCGASLLLSAAGIAATLFGVDLLHIVVLTQGQPWRALWMTSVLAVLLLPLMATRGWSVGPLGRAAVVLLIAAWLLRGEPYAFPAVALALATAVLAVVDTGLTPSAQRIILGGAWVFLGLAAVSWAVTVSLAAPALAYRSHAPLVVRLARTWANDGVVPALALAALCWCFLRNLPTGVIGAVALALSGAIVMLLPFAAAEWTQVAFPPQLYRAFEKWRELIPIGNEVYWPTAPLACWILLERPSFLSAEQSTAALFSRKAAMVFQRRSHEMESVAGGRSFHWYSSVFPHSDAPSLETVCAKSDVRFIVTGYDLRAQALAAAPTGTTAVYRVLRLYQCARRE